MEGWQAYIDGLGYTRIAVEYAAPIGWDLVIRPKLIIAPQRLQNHVLHSLIPELAQNIEYRQALFRWPIAELRQRTIGRLQLYKMLPRTIHNARDKPCFLSESPSTTHRCTTRKASVIFLEPLHY